MAGHSPFLGPWRPDRLTLDLGLEEGGKALRWGQQHGDGNHEVMGAPSSPLVGRFAPTPVLGKEQQRQRRGVHPGILEGKWPAAGGLAWHGPPRAEGPPGLRKRRASDLPRRAGLGDSSPHLLTRLRWGNRGRRRGRNMPLFLSSGIGLRRGTSLGGPEVHRCLLGARTSPKQRLLLSWPLHPQLEGTTPCLTSSPTPSVF